MAAPRVGRVRLKGSRLRQQTAAGTHDRSERQGSGAGEAEGRPGASRGAIWHTPLRPPRAAHLAKRQAGGETGRRGLSSGRGCAAAHRPLVSATRCWEAAPTSEGMQPTSGGGAKMQLAQRRPSVPPAPSPCCSSARALLNLSHRWLLYYMRPRSFIQVHSCSKGSHQGLLCYHPPQPLQHFSRTASTAMHSHPLQQAQTGTHCMGRRGVRQLSRDPLPCLQAASLSGKSSLRDAGLKERLTMPVAGSTRWREGFLQAAHLSRGGTPPLHDAH